MENNYDDIMPLVRQTFMADVPDSEMPKFSDKLRLFWTKTVDFFESNNLPFSKESLTKNAKQIQEWEIGSKTPDSEANVTVSSPSSSENKNDSPKKKCACDEFESIKQEFKKMRKYGIIAFVFLIIVIWATRSSSSSN